MMIRAANDGGSVVPLDFTERKRRLPRSTWIAIGIVGAAHVALGVGLYYQRFEITRLAPPAPQDKSITITMDRPKPPEPKPLPRQVAQPAPAPQTHIPEQLSPWVTETVHATPSPNPTANPGPVIDLTPAPNPAPTGTATETVPPSPPAPAVIAAPRWISQPNAEQLMQAYPDRALRLGIEGRATLRCTVQTSGRVDNCTVLSETPANEGFGRAATRLSRYFRISPRTVDGQAVSGALVDINLRFNLPAD